MDGSLLDADCRSKLPKLSNFGMLHMMVGSSVRVVGRILDLDGLNMMLQTPDGAKISCVLKQQPRKKLSSIVEICAIVMADPMTVDDTIYLEQYGPIHNWEDTVRLQYLNEAIHYLNKPRFSRYFTLNDDGMYFPNLSM